MSFWSENRGRIVFERNIRILVPFSFLSYPHSLFLFLVPLFCPLPSIPIASASFRIKALVLLVSSCMFEDCDDFDKN